MTVKVAALWHLAEKCKQCERLVADRSESLRGRRLRDVSASRALRLGRRADNCENENDSGDARTPHYRSIRTLSLITVPSTIGCSLVVDDAAGQRGASLIEREDRFPKLFFFQAEDGIRDLYVTGVQTCALPI